MTQAPPASMPAASRHDIVCISTIDWDFVWQGHQEIMSTFAAEGHRVLFIENTGVRSVTFRDIPRLRKRIFNWRQGVKGIRKAMENLYVYSPLVLPFPYSRVIRAINKAIMALTLRRWAKTMQFSHPIVWTWLPTGLAMELIGILDAQLVIYYCCDNFQASSPGSRRIRETEDRLIRTADLVFAHSKALFDRCSQLTDRVHIFQYGFNRRVFADANPSVPPDLAGIKRPIVGYVGGIHKAVDFELLEKTARAYPEMSLVLVGPLQVDVGCLTSLPNVHFLGQKKYEDLPGYIGRFDVCLIPYILNEYTRNVFPTKLNEYLIMGKPVVSMKLPEVEYFNKCHQSIVSVADGHETFIKQVVAELDQDNDARRTQRIRLVQKNGWTEKILAMERLVEATLEEKTKTRELNWRKALARFYGAASMKTASCAAVCALAYLVVFHTPFVWWMAEPLKLSQEPVKADIIIVLAGGIGESGEPGEEYREKVKQGVELYRQGYSQRLLLSSGATYVFSEAQVMKALAVSLGVPEAAIMLDERPGGNYLRLVHARNIMEEQGLRSTLVVTSRYNGTRSALVARKHFHNKTVVFTPAADSAFFGHQQNVAWKHLRAIAHEYLAIGHYWLNGYI